jgi:hypothetical protein
MNDAERWAAEESALRAQTRAEFEALDAGWQASLTDTFERALTHAERLGHLEVNTAEITPEMRAAILAEGKRIVAAGRRGAR